MRLIDAKELERQIKEACKDSNPVLMGELLRWVRYQKTVDAVPVVHGRWLYDSGSGKHFCSACDEFALSYRKDRWDVMELYECFLTDYCPNCGAEMDLGVE